MPSSDYSSVGGGLKIKGAKVDKKKKKKSKEKPTGEDQELRPKTESLDEAPDGKGTQESALQKALAEEEQGDKVRETDVKEFGKTEAQRRFEERRKKRLDERLKREGVQTHKERVQQLNKYLSTLSEHNDMPRIGPG